ncbi:hypothetical protein EJ03DRAFT_378276 [Teratosphaeria nubilosa]|uniref:HNH nuclease domain-containing protein n=1 Tax=Teratosphaeria nubilosa TaxID=161662 RepID=A0A6G1KXW0_9PEZI|nr:hypothetical protein EJ03DRAFT_378276 [Teratosphaeria nubilosa]
MTIAIHGPAETCDASSKEARPTTATVLIRHPGYDDAHNELIRLQASDVDGDKCGVAYGLVHDACAIIANNNWAGFLTSLDLPLAPWPVVLNFREWAFPHHVPLPSAWRTAHIEPATAFSPDLPTSHPAVRDGSCRVSDHSVGNETAHLVPASEAAWFAAVGMDRYRGATTGRKKHGLDTIGTYENLILCRADIHLLYDQRAFSIVPKADAAGTSHWVLRVHTPNVEISQRYHNRQLHPLRTVSREYIFARFAWDIFQELRGFLERLQKRWVVTRAGGTELVSGEECKTQFCEGQGRGRSSPSRKSPKRKAQDMVGKAQDMIRKGQDMFGKGAVQADAAESPDADSGVGIHDDRGKSDSEDEPEHVVRGHGDLSDDIDGPESQREHCACAGTFNAWSDDGLADCHHYHHHRTKRDRDLDLLDELDAEYSELERGRQRVRQ